VGRGNFAFKLNKLLFQSMQQFFGEVNISSDREAIRSILAKPGSLLAYSQQSATYHCSEPD
jgi:hypothetical protein